MTHERANFSWEHSKLAAWQPGHSSAVMNLSHRSVALAVMVAASLAAAPAELAHLTLESPFLPAGAGGADPVRQETLELRGIVCQAEGVYFCIYDAAKKKSIGWVGLNEPGHNVVVRAFDAAKNTITVETRDGNKQLKLSKVIVASAGMTPAAAASQPTNPASPAMGGIETITPEERRARIRANFIAERERQLVQTRAASTQPTSGAPSLQ